MASFRYLVRTGELTVSDYIRLFQSAGWEAPPEDQVATALRNSVAVFSIYAGNTLVGVNLTFRILYGTLRSMQGV